MKLEKVCFSGFLFFIFYFYFFLAKSLEVVFKPGPFSQKRRFFFLYFKSKNKAS
jgi:hypothetical protein